MIGAYTRFCSSGSALGHSPSWSLFRHFWAGKFHRHAKIGCVLLFTIATASPRQNETKNKILYTKEGDPKTENVRGARFWEGKRNFGPPGVSPDGAARRPNPREHELPVKAHTLKKGVSPSYGLRFGYTWPPRDRSHDRMHSTGAGACLRRVRYCSSLRGVYPTEPRAHLAERDGSSIRALTEPRRNRNCEAMPRLRSTPRGYPTLPGTNRNAHFAPIFRHHPGIGGHQNP